MRLLSTLLFLFITCWGYAPAGWAQRNHEDDTAEIVHFIFYSDEGAPSVAPAGDAIGCQQCPPDFINDPNDCTQCVCGLENDTCAGRNNQNFIADPDACACVCGLQCGPNEGRDDSCETCQCQLNCPTGKIADDDCMSCICEDCENQAHQPDPDTCACACPNECPNAEQQQNPDTCVCTCLNECGNIPENNQYMLQQNPDTCACACVSDNQDNQNLDWDNVNQQCFQNGCALNKRVSPNDTPGIMDGCCPGEQTAFDSNNDNTNDSCCEAARLYDSDGDNIVDACCAVNLVNGVCPCMDANNNPFIYVQDEDEDPHEFFSDDLVAQANRACGGCPVYKTQNGTRYQLTEIDLGNNRHTCTLRCEKNFYQGIADGPGNIIDDDFVCPCVENRHFQPDQNPHTQIGSSGTYCECAANVRRVIRTDAQGRNFETCVPCQTYSEDNADGNPELFRNVLDFYGIDKNSIRNGGTTIHCPTNGGAGFANQNSRAQTVGINNVACPPMAAMTDAGSPETDPTCSYGDNSDGLVYCYTGTLTNTVGVDHAVKDGDELGKFGRCQDKLAQKGIQLDENAINTRLNSLSNNGKAIRIGLNQGALYIVPQATLYQLNSCYYDAPAGCPGCDKTWLCNFGNSIRETRVMYYGLYSCPFGADADGNCDQKCTNIANSEIRSQNGITYCVCKNGYVPDKDANHPYTDSGITDIYQPGICTSFSAFRVMAPANCLWKGCTEALTGHGTDERQHCPAPGQYLCSASTNKTNYPDVPNGSAADLRVCRKKDSANCPSANFPNTAYLFDDCPAAAGSTSSYFWDDEIWGGKLDQELMSGDITVDEYIEHYYERSCTVVQSGLPYCTQGQTIYTQQNDKYVRQCDCPGLTYPTSPTGEEKCCGFGQIYKNGDCYACPAQSYAISLTDTSCTTCDTGFARNALDLGYARQDGNNPCFQCDAYSFPLEYTAGCYTCAENQIPIYTNASTRATAKTKYDKRCKSANDDCSGDYHWECYTCPDDTVPDGNSQNPDCKPCDQITTPADRKNLNKYACETCGLTWRNNSCS